MRTLDDLRAEHDEAVDDLGKARAAAELAHAAMVAACDDPTCDADLVKLRQARADARFALATARAHVTATRDRLLTAEAQRRAEDERAHQAAEVERRRLEHEQLVAPHVAAVEAALDLVEARDRETFAGGGIAAIIRGEIAAEQLELAAAALEAVEPAHPAIAPARARVAAMAEAAVLADKRTLAALVVLTEHPGSTDVNGAQSALAERKWSKRTGRWHDGDPAREQELLAIAARGFAFLAEQLHGIAVTRQGFHVRTAPGLPAIHRLPMGVERRDENKRPSGDYDGPWTPPVSAREQVALFFGVTPDDAEAFALVPAIRPPASRDEAA